MDILGPGLNYLFLVIPSLLAFTIIGQGIYKISRQEPDGKVALGFGILFLALVVGAYFFFIR